MKHINFNELFPTKLSLCIFLTYMSLFISQGILVTASQTQPNNGYKYNVATVVLFTEVLKLIVSAGLYLRSNTPSHLIQNVRKESKLLVLYFVPAFLYCLYNNLSFINLSTFDPTTYYLLLQFRVVITGVLFQIVFKKTLSRRQWLSLIILTLGCMVKQINFGLTPSVETSTGTKPALSKNTSGFDFSMSAVLIMLQVVCSCLAGVYNEYLLKDKGSNVDIYIQNVFMYLDSIVCNLLLLVLQGDLFSAFTMENLSEVVKFPVLIIMFNNCAIGIVTSFFLKHMNSILKTFAGALELLFTSVLCYFLFAIPIYLNTILSIAIVSGAVYFYSLNPVVNLGLASSLGKEHHGKDRLALLNHKDAGSDDDEDFELQMEAV